MMLLEFRWFRENGNSKISLPQDPRHSREKTKYSTLMLLRGFQCFQEKKQFRDMPTSGFARHFEETKNQRNGTLRTPLFSRKQKFQDMHTS